MNMSDHSNMLGVAVSNVYPVLALEQIGEWVESNNPNYICVANVHTVTECQWNLDLRQVVNRAGMVTPDGMPLVWVSRWMGHKQTQRVYGPDLLLKVCEQSIEMGWKHYFYGGGQGVVELLVKNLTSQFPGLQVVGIETPPFRKLTDAEDQDVVDRINQANPDIVWVGLGMPKQELWMGDHFGRIDAPVMIGVGAAFDFHAGLKPQAPKWMQQSGLEWLFRLLSEPRRLWKRYVINNPVFIILVALQLLGLKKYTIER
ncbi:MAG: WecB/TagA/CpsF family glycosyltransferase [Anaerolineaceae bacterium]|nr:WecB/TagA/CpsF family glycosyltransferase [Anaerolineaceae bacterium]